MDIDSIIPPGKKLWDHQRRFLEKGLDRALLVHETGTGKSITAICWLKQRPKLKAVIICPKGIVGKWQRDLKEWGIKAEVITRDNVKRHDISKYNALVIDEAQDFSSALFAKNRSQRASRIYNHVKMYPKTHILLLTATPIRSTPWNIHTLGCYINHFWPIKEFRDHFFYFTDLYGRYHYELKSDWRKNVRPYVEEIADIVLMKDCIDVPTQNSQVVTIPWTKKQEIALGAHYLEPSAAWHERAKAEQGAVKLKALKGILDGYRKAIVVCYYTEQIERYAKELGKDRAVFVLQGSTKDQDSVIEAAKEADDCIFLIQASMGAGFDASEFSVVIFASMSFRYVDYVQMQGRVKRINNLHENLFIHLIAGKCDKAVYDRIMEGKDFDVHHEITTK